MNDYYLPWRAKWYGKKPNASIWVLTIGSSLAKTKIKGLNNPVIGGLFSQTFSFQNQGKWEPHRKYDLSPSEVPPGRAARNPGQRSLTAYSALDMLSLKGQWEVVWATLNSTEPSANIKWKSKSKVSLQGSMEAAVILEMILRLLLERSHLRFSAFYYWQILILSAEYKLLFFMELGSVWTKGQALFFVNGDTKQQVNIASPW